MFCSKPIFSGFLFLYVVSFYPVFSKDSKRDFIHQDSIPVYLKRLDNTLISMESRLRYADTLYRHATHTQNDTLIHTALKHKVHLHYLQSNWKAFNEARKEHLHWANAIKDSLSQAYTLEYTGYYHKIHHQPDSAYTAYYQAFQMYKRLQDSLNAGKLLLNMANLQVESHDFVGGETVAFQALAFLRNSKKPRGRSAVYNTLGVVYQQLHEIDSSIVYYTKALALRKEIKESPLYLIHTYNNLGVLETKKEAYGKALAHFEAALDYTDYLETDPGLKAYVMDNYTFARFKNGERDGILISLMEALTAREATEDTKGIVISCLHLADYYATLNQMDMAKAYARRAVRLSKTANDFYDQLEALSLLAALEETKTAKNQYFKMYIALRDSLDLVGKRNREQYTRIRHESDQKDVLLETQKEIIDHQRRLKQRLLWGTVALVAVVSLLIWCYRGYRRKKLRKLTENGFRNFLVDKYQLTPENIEFWELWVELDDPKAVASKLGIPLKRIRDRRRSLKQKLYAVEKLEGDFNRYKANIVYAKQGDLFRNLQRKQTNENTNKG